MKSVVVDPGDVRLGRRRAAETALLADHHLRDARARLHPPSQFRRRGEDPRHVCRADREDSVSPATRHHRGRTAAGVPVRRPGCPPGLVNYWGYAPVSFFAPHQAYSSRQDPLGPVDEFRDMVKALHRAGIEVILDVVFNHTAEGDHTRADAELPRAGQQHLLHPRAGPLALRQLQRHAGTRSTPTIPSSAA